MSWLSKHLGIRLDSHTLGNLVKNVSPAAGLIGGPLGLAAAGGLSALGDLGRGKNIGEALGGSLGNVALAGGVSAAKGHMGQLQSLFTPGSGGGASTPAFSGYASNGNGGYQAVGQLAHQGGSNPLAGLGHAFKGAANFAKDNPQAVGMGLQGVGNMASAGSENRLRDAQASRLETQNQLDLDEQEAQRRRAEALAPFMRSLMGQVQQNQKWTMPKNPYAEG